MQDIKLGNLKSMRLLKGLAPFLNLTLQGKGQTTPVRSFFSFMSIVPLECLVNKVLWGRGWGCVGGPGPVMRLQSRHLG